MKVKDLIEVQIAFPMDLPKPEPEAQDTLDIKLAEAKAKLGTRYLLHPQHQVKRLETPYEPVLSKAREKQ